MQVKLTLSRSGDCSLDVAVSARRPVGIQELATLLPEPFRDVSPQRIFSNGEQLPPSARLGDNGLRNGAMLSIGRAAQPAEPRCSVLMLKVTAGPACGRVIPLHRGEHVIGRCAEADIALDDPSLSRRHARLSVGLHAIEIEDLGSTNGITIDDQRLGASPCRVLPNSAISIGTSRLQVAAVSEPPAVVTPDGDGMLLLRRPPRMTGSPGQVSHKLPDAPPGAPPPRIQWLAAVIPAVLSGALALAMHSVQLLAFVALSPVTVLASAMADRHAWRKAGRNQAAEYEQTRHGVHRAVEQSLRSETVARHRDCADAASVLLSATGYNCRLWERDPSHPLFLSVRIGLADQPAHTMVSGAGGSRPAGVVRMVPAVIDLTDHAMGVAGASQHIDGLRRWLIGQLIVLHSPVDLSVVLLADQRSGRQWRWLRWLPANAPAIAVSPEHRQQLAEQLLETLHERKQRQPAGSRWLGRWMLIVIDPADLIAELPGLGELAESGPSVGMAVIWFADNYRSLPASCSATLRTTDASGTEALLTRPGQAASHVLLDRVGPDWSDTIARSLACLRDAEDDSFAGDIDHAVGLRELLGLLDGTAAAVRRRWQSRSDRPATALGITRTGPFELDLVRDGPHLLIAGTTGSGKSELLRALIAGLAAQCPPDELTFVLIDYKGGATFADCAELPHVAAVVTDLDPHVTQRALTSLNAELRRRERAFAQAGVSDLADYQLGCGRTEPVARLVLVIDEFATLAEEHPEMLSGLLDVAQRGRSLGVHLVLATQRPAGVLSADIKANMGLRIALRMTDVAESVDVVGVDAASRISRGTPGRAIARHADGRLEEFQVARVTQPATSPDPISVLELDDWNQPIDAPGGAGQPHELTLLSQAIAEAATGQPRALPPWLEPLPAVLRVRPVPSSATVVFGRSDEPAMQRQSPISFDLAEGDSIAIIGGPRSGRTTALRTMVGTAVSQLTAEDLHVYVIDCAGAGLRPLAQVPHCGAVLEETEPAAVSRLIARLAATRRDRRHHLAQSGMANYAEARRAGDRLPAILLALDGWENFNNLSEEMDAGRTADLLIQLLREGPSAGFTLLLTGDRNVLGGRIAPALRRKLLLPLADRNDYALAGLSRAAVPTRLIAGRAIDADDQVELQLGMLCSDPSAAAQWRSLSGSARDISPASYGETSQLPDGLPAAGPTIRMRALPSVVDSATLLRSIGPSASKECCLLGLGRDDASVIGCDLFQLQGRFLIAGPGGSGRSTAAVLIARQAQDRGLRLVVAGSARSPLTSWAGEHGVTVIQPSDWVDAIDADLVMVDDAEQFADTPSGERLQAWIATSDAAVVVTARMPELLSSFRGLGADMRRHRCGMLLQPSSPDGEVFGVRLPRLPPSSIAGRGVLVSPETRDGMAGYQPIQVAA